MKVNEYKRLFELDFLASYGEGYLTHHWDITKAPFYGKPLPFVGDYEKTFDFNNIIILFPLSNGGVSHLLEHGKYPIDHSTYYLDIKDFLAEQKIRYKNGIKMNAKRYSQVGFGMIIVENGIAYACDTANPLAKLKVWKDSFNEIKYDDSRDKLNFRNKEIVFSGIIVNRIIRKIK